MRVAIVFMTLAAGVFAGCQGGGTPVPRRPPPEEDDGPPAGEVRTCEARFLAHRQGDSFYNSTSNGQIPRKKACDDPVTVSVPERISLPIYWARIGGQWSAESISGKLREASSWFERYCIRLNFQEIPLRDVEVRTIARDLARADAVSPDEHREQVGRIYPSLWGRVGRPKDLLLLLFVDSFRNVQYGERIDRVAGNFDKIPVIFVPGDPDVRSSHIVTHELIHGLGKLRFEDSEPPKTRVPGAGQDRINTWDEGGCSTDMGNAGRGDPSAPLTKPDDHLLDWASYHQFLDRAKTIK